MHNRRLISMLALLVWSMAASAEENKATLTAMFSVDGECSMLLYSGDHLPCRNIVLNTEYDNGRIGFYFANESGERGIVTFSGMGQEQQAPSENLRLQPLDLIILDGEPQQAVGFCTFENPFAGEARIECSAFTENGELFSGFFVSDGVRPKMFDINE